MIERRVELLSLIFLDSLIHQHFVDLDQIADFCVDFVLQLGLLLIILLDQTHAAVVNEDCPVLLLLLDFLIFGTDALE